jgi:hypothetical protein
MPAETIQKTLANSGGYAIVEQGDKLFFVNYGTNWLYPFTFVCALLCLIILINGTIQLPTYRLLGAGMIVAAVAFGVLAVFGVLKIKNSKNLSVEKGNIIAIADIKANEFVDHQQQLKVPLSSVSFDRSFQAFSSSFAIRARWLGGSLVVLRSSPFSGGSGGLVDALKAKGLMK